MRWPSRRGVNDRVVSSVIFVNQNYGWSARILKFTHYIGLSYLAALVLGVILLEQGKNVGISLHPLFAILVWVAIVLIAYVGGRFGILVEQYSDGSPLRDAHTTQIAQAVRIEPLTRFVAAVQIVAAALSCALVLFYLGYKLNSNFGVRRLSDFLPSSLWIWFAPPTLDFALFCMLSAFLAVYGTWVWLEIRISRVASSGQAAGAEVATADGDSVRALWRSFRRPAFAFGYLFLCSTVLFHFFFLRNSYILNFIRYIDSFVGMK